MWCQIISSKSAENLEQNANLKQSFIQILVVYFSQILFFDSLCISICFLFSLKYNLQHIHCEADAREVPGEV